MRRSENIQKDILLFLAATSLLFFLVLVKIPYGGAPDEKMRYDIVEYIYEHMSLPRGDDPEILDDIWGISYAFTPINSYIISGILVKAVDMLGISGIDLLYVARSVSLLFSLGTLLFCIKIGKRLFEGIYSWLFIILVGFLPEFVFISGYVNCDALAVFSVSWIVYALIQGEDQGWEIKSCIFLGVGIGVCALSYYNAYGMILCAVIYCLLSVLFDDKIENKTIFILSRAMWVMGAAFLVAGWWFIRNFILYDGDFLGLSASAKCGEINAMENFKPSNRKTPYKKGYSLRYMLFDLEWIKTSKKSFVATFGNMQYYVEDFFYEIYYLIVGIGLLGNFVKIFKKKEKADNQIISRETVKKCLFLGCMVLACAITIGISIYYSYFNDFQPQGRYCLPMLVPMMVLVTNGIKYISGFTDQKVGKALAYAICMYMAYFVFYSIFCIMITKY